MSNNIILDYGENCEFLFMIQDNIVNLSLRLDKPKKYKFSHDSKIGENELVEFFILPTYSYFGDFNMLMDLRSQI